MTVKFLHVVGWGRGSGDASDLAERWISESITKFAANSDALIWDRTTGSVELEKYEKAVSK